MRCPITSRDIKRSRDIYATYLFHARVDTTRVDGTAVYSGRHVQLAEEDVQDDPGMVEIAAEASSAMAPLLRKVVLDVAGADYQRADLVYWVQSDDQTIIPQPHVFHVLRVLRPPWGIPGTEVSLARLDILTQTATLLERIRPEMAGATRTAAWDPTRSQVVSSADGTFGVGLTLSLPMGATAYGYLPGVPFTLGLNEYAELLQRQVGGNNEIAAEMAGYIATEVDRTNSLITRFLDFARPLRLNREKGDLAALLDRVTERFEREKSGPARSVSVFKNYSPDIPPIAFDPQLLEGAILNLVMNAAQASPPDGVVTIKTRRVEGNPGPAVEIAIIDRGCGIDPKNLESIFNPFFTTKPDGVGLGLAIVSKIIDDHGGKIAVASTRGEGSVFRVYLPVRA